jgi:uncharacterized protein with HEPN domain
VAGYRGLRNFYAHAYEGIDMERMWDDLQRGDVADLAGKLDDINRKLGPLPDASDPHS